MKYSIHGLEDYCAQNRKPSKQVIFKEGRFEVWQLEGSAKEFVVIDSEDPARRLLIDARGRSAWKTKGYAMGFAQDLARHCK